MTEARWTADVLTLFPEMFPGTLGHSLAGRALQENIWALNVHDIRSSATDKHNTVDSPPAGGGHGMVMRPDVVGAALDKVISAYPKTAIPPLIYLSPRGQLLNQAKIRTLSEGCGVILLCGRYEGLDQRIVEHYQMEEVSIGDYILSGGEQAAMVVLDAVVRLLPGVIGKPVGHQQESFETGLLEHDHYTQPRCWRDRDVPETLLSGHHQRIAEWREQNAQANTKHKRPDLWNSYCEKNRSKSNDKV